VREELRAYTLQPTSRGVVVSAPARVPDAVAAALELGSLRLYETFAPYDALTLAPGVLVADDRDVHLTARLRRDGIEVIPVAVSHLGRGRGGPHSLTCPIERDAL
jgi:arginine deiminase